ncbi:HAD-IA family hydrolase [Maribellus comscasis]|uniref:HAD-IA family hydrolase n=1 Tax=Maribellus comscasis TaxID=2681766 RepID=A0A6I6K3C8_9BACT|nr:HAD family phosphatase [Maribellus comscasis]QGY46912.1 HAD-IA family hydrolase [Maribellus comscasis]
MKLIPDNFNAVIFDMDGVLVNSEPFYFEVERQNFEKLGLNISDEEHQTFQGTATDLMWKRLKTKYKLPHSIPELVEMTNSIVSPYFESLENIEPMPGVKKLIQLLTKKGLPLAVASSSYPDVIALILKKTDLKKYFSVVVDSQMAGASKPEPDIFLLTAAKLGVSPEECLVIEDSTNGIKAAQKAGMKVVAFAGPGSEFQDQSEADWVIKDFEEMLG